MLFIFTVSLSLGFVLKTKAEAIVVESNKLILQHEYYLLLTRTNILLFVAQHVSMKKISRENSRLSKDKKKERCFALKAVESLEKI